MQNEQTLEKIKEFIEVLDQMIDGKYILADVKIHKLVKIINECDAIYSFMSECLINFDFENEYNNCIQKNNINGEKFLLPKEPVKLVALVYCLLNAFNSKYLDLYDFMRENFASIHYHTEYLEFGRKVLEPFKNIVSSYFGLTEDGKSLIEFNKELGFEDKSLVENKEETETAKVEIDEKFLTIDKLLRRIINTIKADKKIKLETKENLNYVLNRAIYALNYQDIELISPIVTIVDLLSKKVKSIAWDLNDLKVEILKFYEDKEDVYNEDDLVSQEELDDYMKEAQVLLDDED